MQCIRKIEDDIYWIGAEDRKLQLFENIIPIQKGISYNSYIFIDEKTALLDTVDLSVGKQFLENLEYVLNGRNLDYLMINHMEPDHSSLIEEIILRYPNVEIIGNAQTSKMLKQFFKFDIGSKIKIVNENEQLNIGKHTLKFIFAQMVHWPEVMFTYDETSKILFSADAFGTFGALNGNLYSDDTDFDRTYLSSARRYYCNIVGKYGVQVQNVFKKLEGLEIDKICPLHGPIWRNNISYILEKYDKWSKYEFEEKSVIIIYSSVYGNTENVANVLANKLGERDIKNIKVFDVSHVDVSVLVAESFKVSNIVIISTTYNMGVFPKIEEYINHIRLMNLQNRTFSIIENSTWAPGITKIITEKLSSLKNINILEENLAIKSSIKSEQETDLDKFVESIERNLKDVIV